MSGFAIADQSFTENKQTTGRFRRYRSFFFNLPLLRSIRVKRQAGRVPGNAV
jgi:hypothetical protein